MDINIAILEYMKSLTLLCVEDDKTIEFVYKAIFSELPLHIIYAKDGDDGYEKFLNNKIDIVLTDYKMPKLNGLQMIKKIRKKNPFISIILLSSITDIDVIIDALELNVTNFIKKPIIRDKLIDTIVSNVKLLIANSTIKQKRDQKLQKLQKLQNKEKYSTYQEELAFKKELNILRNDYYYQMIEGKCNSIVDFLYRPLDIMSGDTYSARRITKDMTFYLIVDAMGKGISASLSCILITSYINHIIDKMNKIGNFDFYTLIEKSIEYIKPILLSDEAVAIDYILLDTLNDKLSYADFAMPAILLQTNKNEIIRIKSNNPPLSKYSVDFKISKIDIAGIMKFLFYSDGLVEFTMPSNQDTYASYIEKDFLDSFTKDDFRDKVFKNISIQEDDITFIYINRTTCTYNFMLSKSFNSTLDNVELANNWYKNELIKMTKNENTINSAEIVFTELFMNAYEHGCLGITTNQKHDLLYKDRYFETLLSKEKDINKNISVIIKQINYGSSMYIITQITDDGQGFDTQLLSEFFQNSQAFNGRGVLISRRSSSGIYYNSKGNSVLYLNKI